VQAGGEGVPARSDAEGMGGGMSAKPTKSYVVWRYFGSEGWCPVEFDTLKELQDWILLPGSNGEQFVVTRLLDVRIMVEERVLYETSLLETPPRV
jgi:hypothetical protein